MTPAQVSQSCACSHFDSAFLSQLIQKKQLYQRARKPMLESSQSNFLLINYDFSKISLILLIQISKKLYKHRRLEYRTNKKVMTPIAFSTALLSIIFLCNFAQAAYLTSQHQFQFITSMANCQRVLLPQYSDADGRENLIDLAQTVVNGTGPLEFFGRMARSQASIINALLHNHIFYSRLKDYRTYFLFRYGISLGQALKKRNIFSCKPCNRSTLYPNFSFNKKGMSKYISTDDELDERPESRNDGPDGYRLYYPNINNEGQNTVPNQENSFCLIGLYNAPQQAFCMQQNEEKAEENMKPYFQNKPGKDEHVDQNRRLILNWIPSLNLPQLYGYVSFMTYIAYGNTILDVYQSCADGLYDTSDTPEDINSTP